MTTVAVIPARYASSRFPGKPLACDTGKYLVQHVYERVSEADRIERVIVATDDERIVDAVQSFGGEVRLTGSHHTTGTSRVAEVAAGLELPAGSIVVNVQGDEPDIEPAALNDLVAFLTVGEPRFDIATLATRFDDAGPTTGTGSPLDPHCVKLVADAQHRALYFSRGLLPFPRRGVPATGVDRPSRWLLHLGVYAFRVETLREISAPHGLSPGTWEQMEGLEQLRWLEAGLGLGVVIVEHSFKGIDTPDDYTAFVQRVLCPAGGETEA